MPRWGEVGPLVGGGCAPFFVVTEEGLVPMAVRNVARRSLGGACRSPCFAPTHQSLDSNCVWHCQPPVLFRRDFKSRLRDPTRRFELFPIFGADSSGGRIRSASGCASRRSCSGRTFSPASTSPLGGSNPHSCRNAKGTPRGALRISGRGERIRTSDLSVPNRALYQAEPRPDEGLTLLETARGVQRAPIRIRGRGEFALCGGPRGDGGRGAGGRDPRGVRGPRPEGRRE